MTTETDAGPWKFGNGYVAYPRIYQRLLCDGSWFTVHYWWPRSNRS